MTKNKTPDGYIHKNIYWHIYIDVKLIQMCGWLFEKIEIY